METFTWNQKETIKILRRHNKERGIGDFETYKA